MPFRVPKGIVIAFCIWHMFATGVYALPSKKDWNAGYETRRELLPYVRPYILSLSLWQQWNLFAPDPLRTVTHFVIEKKMAHGWQQTLEITPETLEWYRSPVELKVMRRLVNKEEELLFKRYLEKECSRVAVPGRELRLIKRWHVIPKGIDSVEKWKEWKPAWKNEEIATITCP